MMAIFIGSESSIPHSLRTHARASGKEDIAPATRRSGSPRRAGKAGGTRLVAWIFFSNSLLRPAALANYFG